MDDVVVDMHTRSGPARRDRGVDDLARGGRRADARRSSRSTCPSRAPCRCAATRSAPTAASSPPTCPRSRSTCTTARSTCRRSRSWPGAGTPTCSPGRADEGRRPPRPRRHPRERRRAAVLPRAGVRSGAGSRQRHPPMSRRPRPRRRPPAGPADHRGPPRAGPNGPSIAPGGRNAAAPPTGRTRQEERQRHGDTAPRVSQPNEPTAAQHPPQLQRSDHIHPDGRAAARPATLRRPSAAATTWPAGSVNQATTSRASAGGPPRAPAAMFFVQPSTRARRPSGYMRNVASTAGEQLHGPSRTAPHGGQAEIIEHVARHRPMARRAAS